MLITTHFVTAVRQLSSNKGKAALTILGVVIGIGSVIAIMTLGEIAKNFLLSQISQFGTNVVEVAVSSDFGPFGSDDSIRLNEKDLAGLEESSLLPELTLSTGIYSTTKNMEVNGDSISVSIMGTDANYMTMNNLSALHGRSFTASDTINASRLLVIDEATAEELFDTAPEAVNEPVKIDGHTFTIIGVTDNLPAGGGPFSQTLVYAPVTTTRDLFAPANEQHDLNFLMLEFKPGTNAASFTERLQYELNRLKGLERDSDVITVISRTQFLEIFDSILLGIQLFISAIAGISLVVGGIGIMNIMLVTVKERTKEIGLRKAVGARNRSILFQFLIEAVVLTTVGGLIGIAGGLGICLVAVIVVNALQPDWAVQFVIVPQAIGLACAVSITTGIIFGLYPAWKASRLHPIESLRYE